MKNSYEFNLFEIGRILKGNTILSLGLVLENQKVYSNKKGGEVSTFFAPNLTMNLTYLCYGESKIVGSLSQLLKTR